MVQKKKKKKRTISRVGTSSSSRIVPKSSLSIMDVKRQDTASGNQIVDYSQPSGQRGKVNTQRDGSQPGDSGAVKQASVGRSLATIGKAILDKKVNQAKNTISTAVALAPDVGGLAKTKLKQGAIMYDYIRKGEDRNTADLVDKTYDNMREGGKYMRNIMKTITKNHPSWYENYPLGGLVGANFARRKGIFEVPLNSGEVMSVPSVTGLRIDLTIPKDISGAYDQAINIMYNKIRRANSGAVNYTPGALGCYVETVRTIHALYCVARRAYATLFSFSAVDASIPSAFFAAYGLDYDTFRANAGNLKSQMSIWSAMIKELCPLSMPVLDRTDWLFSNAFADSNDFKASYYVFRLGRAYYYDPSGTVNIYTASSSSLTSTTTGLDYTSFINTFVSVLTDFRNTPTFAVIAGDILKAYGVDAMYQNEVWGENMQLPLIYDEAALTQIQNAKVPVIGDPATEPIAMQVVSAVGPNGMPTTSVNWAGPATGAQGVSIRDAVVTPMINSYKDTITPGELISYTRFTPGIVEPSGLGSWDNNTPATIVTFGTEIISSALVIRAVNTSTNAYGLSSTLIGIWAETTFVDEIDNAQQVCKVSVAWSSMDWAPITINQRKDRNTLSYAHVYMWDFNNYAKLDYDQLSTYHAVAALSLYYTEGRLKEQKLIAYR